MPVKKPLSSRVYIARAKEIINNAPENTPIYADLVANELIKSGGITPKQARHYTNTALSLSKDEDIISYLIGRIFYKTNKANLDKSKINTDDIIEYYYTKGNLGYLSGPNAGYAIGLQGELFPEKIIVTNEYKKRFHFGKNISTSKPRTPITEENKLYLQLLDAILWSKYWTEENPNQKIDSFIKENNLDHNTLIYFAEKYHSRNTVKKLLNILIETGHIKKGT